MRIDAHQHFWRYDPRQHSWINDDMAVIRRDYFPGDLESELKNHGINGTVAVQADETDDETDFLLALAEKNDFIKGVVGWINMHSPELELALEKYKDAKKLKGFRCIMQGVPDEKYLTNRVFSDNLKKISIAGYTYDLLVYHKQLPKLIKMTDMLPDSALILDHIAKPDIKNKQFNTWKENIKTISAHPGIYCKLSGMITEADFKNWKYDDLMPYMEISAEYFGVDRLCFGSDWPVCLVAGSYKQVFEVVNKFVSQLSVDEQSKIFGKNATDFYKLNHGSESEQ
jgi:L-fuconolactonase